MRNTIEHSYFRKDELITMYGCSSQWLLLVGARATPVAECIGDGLSLLGT